MRRIVLVPVVISVAVAGCGDSNNSTDDAPAPSTTQAATPPTTTKQESTREPRGPRLPSPDEADNIARGLTLAQVFERLGDSRDEEPRDRIDCMYWTTSDPTQEIEVCFTNEAVSRSKSSRLVPAP